MIASSVLNFVRQKADEAAQWAKLHEQLKALAGQERKIKEETAKIAEITIERAKSEKDLAMTKEQLAAAMKEQAKVADLAASRIRAADEHVSAAQRQADAIAAKTRAERDAHINEWHDKIAVKRAELLAVDDAMTHEKAALASLRQEHAELAKQHQELQRKHQALQTGLAALTPNL